ncbi:MAG: hypothetical protein M3487_06650 [Actinomycetota bacterium]|nr:hypothetical protein [Actinomycetota bacterium]
MGVGVVVAAAAALAVALHRSGHSQGDDFALYLRQARSVFDGDPAQVVADNRFTVIHSGGSFSPLAYPWGLPLLLAPFVRAWGLDYDRLKLVEVAAFCVWLVLVHGIVRRRLGRIVALAVTAAVGTTPMLLVHTDSLLSEFPHAAAVAVMIWWLDRIRGRATLITASARDLIVLGVLLTVTYNIRRETVLLVAAIATVQIVELVARRRNGGPGSPRSWPWRALAMPHAAFVASAMAFQLVLPSMLLPANGDSGPRHLVDRLREYPAVLAEQLGIDQGHAIGMVILLVAFAGLGVGLGRRPGLDGPLAAVVVFSALAVSTHFRLVGRYYFQILPWVLMFVAAAVLELARFVTARVAGRSVDDPSHRSRWSPVAAVITTLPLLFLVILHVTVLPTRIASAMDFDRDGRQQVGPTHPDYLPIYDAVIASTKPMDVVVFYRARTMTLLTDRRTLQTTNLDRAAARADFYAQQRGSTYSQPEMTELEGYQRGFTVAWSNDVWILWDLDPG